MGAPDEKDGIVKSLISAAKSGSAKKLQRFLEKGGAEFLDFMDAAGQTALHWAALEGHLECVELLVENGATTDLGDSSGGRTPLHWAASGGQIDVVRYLVLTAGVFVDAEDEFTRTALHFAARAGHKDVVKFLLEHGADPTLVDKDGNTPEELAIMMKRQKRLSRVFDKYRALSLHSISSMSLVSSDSQPVE